MKTDAIKAQLDELSISKIEQMCKGWERRYADMNDGVTILFIYRRGIAFGVAGEWPNNLLNAIALAIAAGEMEL